MRFHEAIFSDKKNEPAIICINQNYALPDFHLKIIFERALKEKVGKQFNRYLIANFMFHYLCCVMIKKFKERLKPIPSL